MADVNIKEVADKVMKAIKDNPELVERLMSDPKGLIEKAANIKNLSAGDLNSVLELVKGGKDGGLLGGLGDSGLDLGGIAGGLLGGKKKQG